MYGEYLAHKLPLYWVAGILCALLMGSNAALMKYNRSLKAITEKTGALDVKKMLMKRDTHEVALRVKELQGLRPEGFWHTPPEEFILKAIDDTRRRMKGDVLTVATINREASQLSLPIELTFNFDTYARVVQRLYDLERMTFPFFQLTSFSFQKEQPERALCTVRGNLVIPATGGGG